MKPDTALALLLCAASALWSELPQPRKAWAPWLQRALACGALGLALWSFMDPSRNRMALSSAVAIGFASLALLLRAESKTRLWLSQALALGIFYSCLVSLLFTFFNALQGDHDWRVPSSLPAVAGLLLLGASIALLDWGAGLGRIFPPHLDGSIWARRFLPAALALPLMISVLRLKGQEAGLYDTSTGFALGSSCIIGFLVLFIAISAAWLNQGEQKRLDLEQRLRRSESFYQILLDQCTTPIYAVDREGIFLFANKSYRGFFGMPKDNSIISSSRALTDPKATESFLASFQRVLEGEQIGPVEVTVHHGDHDGVYLVNRFPLLDGDGSPIYGMGGMSADITAIKRQQAELKQALLKLERANAELESFSYSVSHDLRAPLRSLTAFSRILLEEHGEALNAEAKDLCQRMDKAAKRMGLLVDGLLGLSRTGRTELKLEALDLSAMAAQAFSALEGSARASFEVEKGLKAQGDSQLIQLVMQNLFENALKFSSKKAKAEIRFGAEARPEGQAFYVKDNGAGFDMDYAGQLFGAFQRLHHETEFPGTGIGLATVQRVILRHGGRVWAESAPGLGATFYFTLPSQGGLLA
jgi:PAS domain S-box-containing protein